MKPALAIDFDGTIAMDGKFPHIGMENRWVDRIVPPEERDGFVLQAGFWIDRGRLMAPATHVIKRLQDRFDIIIHTCRSGKPKQMMVDWLASVAHCPLFLNHDYSINFNPRCPEADQKPFADVYLDNRGLTWHQFLPVEDAINALISTLPQHTYTPQTV